MQALDRTCGSSKILNSSRVYFNYPSLGNSSNYYTILGSQRKGYASHKSIGQLENIVLNVHRNHKAYSGRDTTARG